VHWFASEVLVLRDGADQTSLGTLPSHGSPRVHVNAFSWGLSNATEEQQVYSAIWDMPMLSVLCATLFPLAVGPAREKAAQLTAPGVFVC
jgi:hypothetical protein